MCDAVQGICRCGANLTSRERSLLIACFFSTVLCGANVPSRERSIAGFFPTVLKSGQFFCFSAMRSTSPHVSGQLR